MMLLAALLEGISLTTRDKESFGVRLALAGCRIFLLCKTVIMPGGMSTRDHRLSNQQVSNSNCVVGRHMIESRSRKQMPGALGETQKRSVFAALSKSCTPISTN